VTKVRALERLNRTEDAVAARSIASAVGRPLQLNSYGRQLQTEGRQAVAFNVFRDNISTKPGHWVTHYEAA